MAKQLEFWLRKHYALKLHIQNIENDILTIENRMKYYEEILHNIKTLKIRVRFKRKKKKLYNKQKLICLTKKANLMKKLKKSTNKLRYFESMIEITALPLKRVYDDYYIFHFLGYKTKFIDSKFHIVRLDPDNSENEHLFRKNISTKQEVIDFCTKDYESGKYDEYFNLKKVKFVLES
jgi:hypothetical protein